MAPAPDAPPPHDEDAVAMRRIQAGDETAFAALMDRWERPVKALISRLVLNTADAADLAQETFVRVWQHRARYDPARPFKPWVLGIAVNLARNRLRWWRRRPSVSLDTWMDEGETAQDDPGAGAAGLEQRERARAVRDAIAALPHDLREALVLFEYEGLSQTAIAAVVGASPKAVESRVARARARLRTALAAWCA